MRKQDAAVLHAKPHFAILDGLRGVAAIAIVVFHFMEIIITDFTKNFIAHGFLAVDFFFCLSGFVIAYAYDNRMGTIGFRSFFKKRLVRLHPLVILGTVLGVLGLLWDPFSDEYLSIGTKNIVLAFVAGLLMVPWPFMEQRYFNNFSLNAPSWSLFWEYMASVLYGLILWRLNRKMLLFFTLLAAVLLCFVGYRAGNLLGGWAGSNFWEGGARVAYSFSAGMLIYRSNWIIKNKLGFGGLTLLLLTAFMVPYAEQWAWLTELVIVLFYFPLLVALGAGARLGPAFEKVCDFSGQISYPLYMTHYVAMWIFGHYFAQYHPGTNELIWIVIGGTVLLIGFAYLWMVIYDIPVRRYLTAKIHKLPA